MHVAIAIQTHKALNKVQAIWQHNFELIQDAIIKRIETNAGNLAIGQI